MHRPGGKPFSFLVGIVSVMRAVCFGACGKSRPVVTEAAGRALVFHVRLIYIPYGIFRQLRVREMMVTSCVGRKKRWHEVMGTPFPKGTFERMRAVREKVETKTDFVRRAVERELKRREKRR
jgi:hypothetical protein